MSVPLYHGAPIVANPSPRSITQEDVNNFLAALNERDKEDNFKPGYTAEKGPKYTRIVSNRHGRSCFCFLENATGNILKSAGWKTPEKKNPRGHIWTPTHGVEFLGRYGAAYLKY